MKWITREHVKVDRVACPWLIKKFVDKDAEFIFVPGDKVMDRSQAPRRHPVRREERRTGSSRQGMLVRGDRQEVQAHRRSRARAARQDRQRRRHRQHAVSPGRRTGARTPSPKAFGISATRTITHSMRPSGSSTTRSTRTARRWSGAANLTEPLQTDRLKQTRRAHAVARLLQGIRPSTAVCPHAGRWRLANVVCRDGLGEAQHAISDCPSFCPPVDDQWDDAPDDRKPL